MTTTPPPPVLDDQDGEAPAQRKGRYCGWEGKGRFDFGALRLRSALTKLARDPDAASRAAGAALSDEAAELLHALATRAENETTAAKRAAASAERKFAALAPKLAALRAAQDARRSP